MIYWVIFYQFLSSNIIQILIIILSSTLLTAFMLFDKCFDISNEKNEENEENSL
jgi:hypothetical protein